MSWSEMPECLKCGAVLGSDERDHVRCDACRTPPDPQPQSGPQAASSGSWEEICEVLGERSARDFSEFECLQQATLHTQYAARASRMAAILSSLAALIRAGEVPGE